MGFILESFDEFVCGFHLESFVSTFLTALNENIALLSPPRKFKVIWSENVQTN